MDAVLVIGRILFGLIFVGSGAMGHLMERKGSIDYARQAGAPAPETTVPATGVVILAGGLSVILGVWADLGALLLLAFVVPTAFIMHPFWKESDPQQQQNQMAHFMKNMSLAGAAIIVFWLVNQGQGNIPAMLTDPLFGAI